MKKIDVHTDGGSRGNPGPAAIGVFIEGDGQVLAKISKRLGNNTNNFAEYSAVIAALDFLLEHESFLEENTTINFFMDSQLIYSQISGLYKIKNAILRELLLKVREKESRIRTRIYYNFVNREENKMADKLVNLALDNIL